MTRTDPKWTATYRRLQAIAKQRRRGNEDPNASKTFTDTKLELERAIRELETRMHDVVRLEKMANMPLAKLKTELSPPDGCETVAVFDVDEVSFYYENDGEMVDIPWPFESDYVWPDDCEAVGIRVE